MSSVEEREQNLFNATDTMAQFYYEIETFLRILYGNMERSGYSAKAERLRSGAFTTKNLTRRLLANATVVYIKAAGQTEDVIDEEETDEEDEAESKSGKQPVTITSEMRMPFVHISLFRPKTIPSVRTLSSPKFYFGAVGELAFIDKQNGNSANPSSRDLALSNLATIQLNAAPKKGDFVTIRCWNPKPMKKYLLRGRLVGLEAMSLLSIDSQERIREISDKLIMICDEKGVQEGNAT